MGTQENIVRWLFDSYYSEESLGFAYSQIGQENSFLYVKDQVLAGMSMQIEQLLKRGDVEFKKMGETGELFKSLYPEGTPATSVVALNNFDTADVQSVYYDCKNYSANLFRFEDKIFFRSLFLFDERISDLYLENTCTTFDAIYENLPLVDTMTCPDEYKKSCGLEVCSNAKPFTAKKVSDGVLTVEFNGGAVTFFEDRIEIITDMLLLYSNSIKADFTLTEGGLSFEYKGYAYDLIIEGANLSERDGDIKIVPTAGRIVLYPKKA
jgi:hypothetical protein